MLTLNTNLTGLITQSSLKTSTNRLNQAVEQMTSGFKINHASDNAANYSISTTMSTKISAYQIAEENVNMGLDLLSTANDILSSMQDKVARLSALSTQARNGTYGASSLAAINAEANAIIDELIRDYNNAQYNNISLFNQAFSSLPYDAPRAGESKFIADIVEETPDIVVSDPNQLASAISSKTKIGIANAETLAKLAELVNSGTNCSGKTIILTDDIDLSAYDNWKPIGESSSNSFRGTFNGNGHVVRKLTINRPTENCIGLFGDSRGNIKNIGVENVNINGYNSVGGLAGTSSSSITNCYATGNVTGNSLVGGLAGTSSSSITNSYATGNVTGNSFVGGLAGNTDSGSITNSYATGTVTGQGNNVGGLVGYTGSSSITNSYSLGNVNENAENLYYSSDGSTSLIDTTITTTTFQVGIQGDDASRITTDTNFIFNFASLKNGMEKDSTFDAILALNALLSAKQTDLGAVQNRLESALEEIATNYDNLVSSRSTLRDADIAEVSSRYIQQQILQQASATLMATANQSPAIALQLI